MQHAITVLKRSNNAVEFQGITISAQKFLSRMARSGFDAQKTERMFARIKVGGTWVLILSRAQVRMISKEAWKNVA